jgi:magnesium chelatase family protein
MLAKLYSAALVGIDAHLIEVEVDISGGLPQFSIVGLPDATVRESRDRVRAALKNCGCALPAKKITVNLAPAGLKKEGAGLDLAIALGVLVAEQQLSADTVAGKVFVGELSLDGILKPATGVLSMALACRAAEHALIVSEVNAGEAAVVEGLPVYPVRTLPQVIEFLRGQAVIAPRSWEPAAPDAVFPAHDDLSDVQGQEHAKRALEVAAAGGHNLLMIGPPGSGKSMLAKRLAGILPPLEPDEAIETTRIHSVAGLLSDGRSLLTARPFRAPHHNISDAGLIGGGATPRPGEVSLAHHGVLFLDEIPEFKRHVLEGLRQPLEDGTVVVSRVNGSVRYPARFMLVAAMNPCACGHYGDRQRECLCTPTQIRKYRARLSGPLLDRMDIHITVPPVPIRELTADRRQESSASIRDRVTAARGRQTSRYRRDGIFCNAQLKPRLLKKHCAVDQAGHALLEQAMGRLGLSARAYGRILRVARTIADLDRSETITSGHLAEAIQYRTLDRRTEL